jgi:hypothetical protein
MASFIENTILGYVNTDKVRIGPIVSKTERDTYHLNSEKTVYFFMIIAGRDSISSDEYDSYSDANTAREALKTNLGI